MARTEISDTTGVAAPRTTAVLAGLVGLGVLLQGAFAGGFLSGHHVWRSWHEALGNLLIVLPLASLVAAFRGSEARSMLASRVGLLVLLILVIATGHAGRSLLPLHIPAAIATVGLIGRQFVLAVQAIPRR